MNSDTATYAQSPLDWLSRSVSVATIFAILAAIDFLYQYAVRDLLVIASLQTALIDALLYTSILWISVRLDLARVTLCFLALPYLIFIPGWLNTPTAIALLIIFLYCLIKTIQTTSSMKQSDITIQDLFAFILILIWVNMSGAGGYGFQHSDYRMNNARLMDLINYDWPVRYGQNQNFVYYIGYFLPSSILGKLTNLDLAVKSMYVWTTIGVTLAIRWMSLLSRWRFSISLVAIFLLFGPLDVLNLGYILYSANYYIPLHELIEKVSGDPEILHFGTSRHIDFFIGNYLSNTLQLYWSPQQVIAGWLCMGFITYLFIENKVRQLLFVYSLLCLWAPLVMIAMFPLIVAAVLMDIHKNWRDIITIENTLGAGTLTCLFLVFYLSGSAGSNYSIWIINAIDWKKFWDVYAMFHLSAWGIYALAIIPFVAICKPRFRVWFVGLVFTCLFLPIRTFGEWSDLLCRGSAPLMFLLLVFLLRAVQHYWVNNKQGVSVCLFCLLIPGFSSALFQNILPIQRYGDTQPFANVYFNADASENFGPDNTIFEKLFRRKLFESSSLQP